nr:MAG TPA: hypothetical protein [Caudoviricetes sp.]
MKPNATAVANYLIELSERDQVPIRLTGLLCRVYACHGFSLAINNRPLVDPMYDRIESWYNGVAIPSVYHSFKCYHVNPVLNPAYMSSWDGTKDVFYEPRLESKDDRELVETVWMRYILLDDKAIRALMCDPGTPWSMAHVFGENRLIPDDTTKWYYTKVMELIQEKHRKQEKRKGS